jgi:hypothetical protein
VKARGSTRRDLDLNQRHHRHASHKDRFVFAVFQGELFRAWRAEPGVFHRVAFRRSLQVSAGSPEAEESAFPKAAEGG